MNSKEKCNDNSRPLSKTEERRKRLEEFIAKKNEKRYCIHMSEFSSYDALMVSD